MHRVSESLAGRATYVNLWPLTRRERLGLGVPGIWDELLSEPVSEWVDLIESRRSFPADWRDEVRVGGYPTPAVELASDDALHGAIRKALVTLTDLALASPYSPPDPDPRRPHARRHRGESGGRVSRGGQALLAGVRSGSDSQEVATEGSRWAALRARPSRGRYPAAACGNLVLHASHGLITDTPAVLETRKTIAALPQPARDLLPARPPGALCGQSHQAADQDSEALLERPGARAVAERLRSRDRSTPGDVSC